MTIHCGISDEKSEKELYTNSESIFGEKNFQSYYQGGPNSLSCFKTNFDYIFVQALNIKQSKQNSVLTGS